MNPYPSYKDSGLPSLGAIPEHWEARRLKFSATINPSKSGTLKNLADDTLITFLPMENVSTNGVIDCSIKKPLTEVREGFTYFERNDVVVAKITPCFENGKGACLTILDTQIGFGTTEFIVLRPSESLLPEFLYNVTKSGPFRKMGAESMTGSAGQQRISSAFVADWMVALPPPAEQAAIVAYLDRKTADIERFIRKKKQLIVLLNEQKAAIINRAVTRGLDPDVPMKASGLSTHPKMPQHWQEKRLKFLCHIRYGLGQPPKERLDGLPLIRATNVERGRIVGKGMVYVDPKDVPAGREAVLHTGEIVVVRSGAYTADSAIIPTEYDGAIVGYDMVVKPTNINASFLAQAFLSRYVLHDQLFPQRMRAAQPHLNKEELGETLFFVPPIEEQSVIADFIKTEVTKIYSAITRIESEIELIQEYRTTLISDAVTGKIDVRQTEESAEILTT